MSATTTPKAFGVCLFTEKKLAEAVRARSGSINTQLKQGVNDEGQAALNTCSPRGRGNNIGC